MLQDAPGTLPGASSTPPARCQDAPDTLKDAPGSPPGYSRTPQGRFGDYFGSILVALGALLVPFGFLLALLLVPFCRYLRNWGGKGEGM